MYLHDASLHSIQLQADNAVALGISKEDGTVGDGLLTGVERMRVFDFREGNIILEVCVITGAKPPIDVLQKLFDLEVEEIPDYLRKRISDIENGTLTLVHVIPSYGAELIALCKGYSSS